MTRSNTGRRISAATRSPIQEKAEKQQNVEAAHRTQTTVRQRTPGSRGRAAAADRNRVVDPPAARISGRLHEGKKVDFECLQPKRCPNTITLMMVVDKSPGPGV